MEHGANLGCSGNVRARLPGAEPGESTLGLRAEGVTGFHRPPGRGVENGLQRLRVAAGSPRRGRHVVPARGDAGWNRDWVVVGPWAWVLGKRWQSLAGI